MANFMYSDEPGFEAQEAPKIHETSETPELEFVEGRQVKDIILVDPPQVYDLLTDYHTVAPKAFPASWLDALAFTHQVGLELAFSSLPLMVEVFCAVFQFQSRSRDSVAVVEALEFTKHVCEALGVTDAMLKAQVLMAVLPTFDPVRPSKTDRDESLDSPGVYPLLGLVTRWRKQSGTYKNDEVRRVLRMAADQLEKLVMESLSFDG